MKKILNPKKQKIKKEKKNLKQKKLGIINWFKLVIKDLKRVRWPKIKDVNHTFVTTVFFIVLISLVLFGIAFGFGEIWNKLKVGVNG